MHSLRPDHSPTTRGVLAMLATIVVVIVSRAASPAASAQDAGLPERIAEAADVEALDALAPALERLAPADPIRLAWRDRREEFVVAEATLTAGQRLPAVRRLEFAPGGRTVAMRGPEGHAVAPFDPETGRVGEPVRLGAPLANAIGSAAFLSDDRLVTSHRGEIVLWDLSARPPAVLQRIARGSWTSGLAASPDGRWLASCLGSGRALLYEHR